MATHSLLDSLGLLAEPIVRTHDGDRMLFALRLNQPVDAVRVRLDDPSNGSGPVADASAAPQPVGDGTYVADLSVPIPSGDPTAWTTVVEFDHGNDGGSPFAGDLALFDLRMPIIDRRRWDAGSEPAGGAIGLRFGFFDLGVCDFVPVDRDHAAQLRHSVRTELRTFAARSPSLLRRWLSEISHPPSSCASTESWIGALTDSELLHLMHALAPDPLGAAPDPARTGLYTDLCRAQALVYAPAVSLRATCAPTLLGFALGRGSLVGTIGPSGIEVSVLAELADLLAALVPATSMGRAPVPALIDLSLPLPGSAASLAPFSAAGDDLDAAIGTRVEWLTKHLTATAAIDLSIGGFGIERGAMRFVWPELHDHPSNDARWVPIDRRRGRPRWPTRAEILEATVAGARSTRDLLADPSWDQRLARVARRLPRQTADVSAMSLGDIFPHGGFTFAGLLTLPAALARHPLATIELLESVRSARPSPMRSPDAFAEWLRTNVTNPRRVGVLAGYLPAPTPRNLETPADALADWRANPVPVPFGGPTTGSRPAAVADIGFLQARLGPGRVTGAATTTILGLPIVGGDLVASRDRLTLAVEPHPDSWLARLTGTRTPLEFEVGAPGVDLDEVCGLLVESWRTAQSGAAASVDEIVDAWSVQRAGRLAEQLGVDPDASPDLERLTSELAAQVRAQVEPVRNLVESWGAAFAALGRSARPAATASALTSSLVDAMRTAGPRLALRRRLAQRIGFPGLDGLIRAAGSITLVAYTPGWRSTPGNNALEQLQHDGGIGLEFAGLSGRFGSITIAAGGGVLTLVPAPRLDRPPILRGEITLASFEMPGTSGARAVLVVDTSSASPISISVEFDEIDVALPGGSVTIGPAGRATVVRAQLDVTSGRLHIAPAAFSLTLPLVEVEGNIHGATPTDPFSLDPNGDWADARVSLRQFRLANPFAPTETLYARSRGLGVATLSGSKVRLAGLTAPTLPPLAMTPVHSALRLHPAGGPARFELAPDGGFEFRLSAMISRLDLFEVTGEVVLGVSAGSPTCRISDASLRLPFLDAFATGSSPVTLAAAIEIDESGLHAAPATTTRRFGLANLFQVRANTWATEFDPGSDIVALSPGTDATAWILGRQVSAFASGERPRLSKTGSAPPAITATSSTWLSPSGLNTLLAIKPRASLTANGVRLEGAYRLLQRTSSSAWKISGTGDWTVPAGAFEFPIGLPDGAMAALLETTGIVRRRSSTGMRWGRDDDGYYVALYRPRVRVLWKNFDLPTARMAANGKVSFRLADVSFDANGLSLVPDGDIRVEANLRENALGDRFWIPAGSIEAAFSGFPTNFSFPRVPSSGWSTVERPTRSTDHSQSVGSWRPVPLVGGATGTHYRCSSPSLTVALRDSSPGLRAQLHTGGLRIRQATGFGGFTYLTLGGQTYTVSSSGGLAGTVGFGSVSSLDDNPNLDDLIG